jgi:hypothetical protein
MDANQSSDAAQALGPALATARAAAYDDVCQTERRRRNVPEPHMPGISTSCCALSALHVCTRVCVRVCCGRRQVVRTCFEARVARAHVHVHVDAALADASSLLPTAPGTVPWSGAGLGARVGPMLDALFAFERVATAAAASPGSPDAPPTSPAATRDTTDADMDVEVRERAGPNACVYVFTCLTWCVCVCVCVPFSLSLSVHPFSRRGQ